MKVLVDVEKCASRAMQELQLRSWILNRAIAVNRWKSLGNNENDMLAYSPI